MRNFYDFVSYSPSTGPNPGTGIIRVIGCTQQTAFDVPPNTVQDDPTWQDTVAQVIAAVLTAVDPNSPSYDATLDNWANETE
jgi:hypothetical protein